MVCIVIHVWFDIDGDMSDRCINNNGIDDDG
jgi:hypothetical protein